MKNETITLPSSASPGETVTQLGRRFRVSANQIEHVLSRDRIDPDAKINRIRLFGPIGAARIYEGLKRTAMQSGFPHVLKNEESQE
jgi:hypothetical protein